MVGNMKPDVVFFGESVPRNQVNRGMESLEEANAMLVVDRP
jgi:NAD-dependent SIR2 family protein deacetylase